MQQKNQYRQSFGKWGEKTALNYLHKKGYLIIQQNYRSPFGEIDIIAQDKETIVFCEVKTRSSHTYGFPEESISTKKLEHIYLSAVNFLSNSIYKDFAWRIDIIAITKMPNKALEIIHLENASL